MQPTRAPVYIVSSRPLRHRTVRGSSFHVGVADVPGQSVGSKSRKRLPT